ncbi:hypothetical protein UH38_04090 [Aliterella atlantica CENA595]|uniref:Carbohydrate-binding/sugar hydrolysis domain-containing protein n=2 Tax=Aliterella TaxID=1827277 RepID=A0A0D8ZZW9_9CYAN|nr:hypothetical protein UH38_04090 [Aliterella atlantica CENA595]
MAQSSLGGTVVPVSTTTSSASNRLFVNSGGNSANADGSQNAPFKTITQALQVAPPNSVIMLASGTYSAESGEKFPLLLKPGISIQGNPQSKGQGIIIQGGGTYMSRTFARQNITILGANNAAISGVTITNNNLRGYGLWIESTSPVVTNNTFTGNNHDGISITGSSSPQVSNNYFYQNGANGMTIYGTSQPKIQENVFEKTGFGINIAQKSAPIIINNRIVQNRSGIVTQASARPILRGNVIEGNTEDGIVAIAQSQPDLGTQAEPGKNVFRQNGRYDINGSASKQVLVAFGNQLASDRISGNLDLSGTVSPRTQIAQNIPVAPQTPRIVPTINRSAAMPKSPRIVPTINRSAAMPKPPVVSNPIVTPKPPSSNSQPIVVVRNRRNPIAPTATTNNTSESAINIPVPLPDSNSELPSAEPVEIATVPQGSNLGSVAINDLPPQPTVSDPLSPPPIDRNLPVLESAQISEAELLPVPGGNIPVGNSRKLPKPTVNRSAPTSTAGGPPTPPTQATILGFRYRVVVEADSKSRQDFVRSVVPGAFRTFANGKVLMQVGAYKDRAEADAMMQLVGSKGLRGVLEELN